MHYYQVNPPQSTDDVVLTINYQYVHLTSPKPDRLSQQDGLKQGMVWEADLLGGFGSIPYALADNLEVKVKVMWVSLFIPPIDRQAATHLLLVYQHTYLPSLCSEEPDRLQG